MLKKFLSFLLIWILIWEFSFFWVSEAGVWCASVTWFALYNCRVDDICKKYNGSKKEKTNLETKDLIYTNSANNISDSDADDVYVSKQYLTPEDYYKNKDLMKAYEFYNYSDIPFLMATKTYKTNMNWIYRCAILFAERKALDEIEKIINIDTSWTLAKKTDKKLKHQIKEVNKKLINKKRLLNNKIEKAFAWKCSKLNYKDVTRIDILKETTYETCKFRMYMQYLKEDYYKHWIKNLLKKRKWKKVEPSQWSTIWYKYNEILTKIDAQIDHSYSVFQRAYEEYTAYESNYTMHLLLQLLKDEYIVVRERLHNVLTPINQVVYKIKNAMIQQ